MNVTAYDIMDTAEVAEAFGVTVSSVGVAMSFPKRYPGLAAKLPLPLRKVGSSWVWSRDAVEAALVATSDQADPHGMARPVVTP